MPIRFIFLFLGLTISFTVFGQENTKIDIHKTSKTPFDSLFIKTFPGKFVPRLIIGLNETSVDYEKKGEKTLNYLSNNPLNIGLGIDYKWLSLEYTQSLETDPEDLDKGSTKTEGFGLGLSTRKIWFKSFLQYNQGFYLENTDEILPGFYQRQKSFYTRPDLKTATLFTSLNYGFNTRKFSHSANLYQLEKQTKSAGSFVMGLSFALNAYQADSVLTPQKGAQTPYLELLKEFGLASAGLNIGYVHNFCFGKDKNWFVSLAMIPAIMYEKGEIKLGNGTIKEINGIAGFMAEGRFGFGYNSDLWFLSINSRAFSMTNDLDAEDPLSITYTSTQISYGYRFEIPKNRPGWLKKLGL
jgi:hypothetical protein